MEIERNLGTQPLDAVMQEAGLGNHDLVAACAGFLTHKAVQRARKGRRLTAHMKRRVAEAVTKAMKARDPAQEREWKAAELFNY
ncbi:MAG: hypothetical protein CJBNEKGG_02506 [Prosthecobacter sp.]|nr:hypothetical protein [Prosthecobacter sp.]